MLSSSLLAAMLVSAVPGGSLDFEPCRLGADGGNRLAAECATFTVAENPDEPEGRQIDLKLAWLKAKTNEPAAEPLVFIAGGPGQSALESFPGVAAAFGKIRQQRPILLVDQRGTGESNRLDCPMDEFAGLEEPSHEEMLAWGRKCVEEMEADPRFYTTVDAVRDLEAVREALGVPQYMLYGISYGSRVALEYLREHPEALKAVVVDGVAAPSEPLGLEIASDAQVAFDSMLARCETSESCNEAFPELRSRFDAMQARLEDEPVTVALRDPRTGEFNDVEIGAASIAMVVRMSTYRRESLAILPLQLSKAANGDFHAIGGTLQMMAEGMPEMMAMGMHMAVVCHEDVPFYPDNATEASENTYLGAMSVEMMSVVCSEWPTRDIGTDIKQPVESDVPVLLLSGEFDPVTPPSNAEKVLKGLDNARHIVAPGQGHGVAWAGCMPEVLTDFYAGTAPAELEAECVERLETEPFFIDLNGPTP
ncbi:MAG: alpha/beta hydrolase [Gammaproteobacteria bacterium]|nr:alpha/beta hydrolase [Gammaproteobacteria bacterium]